MVYIFFLSLTAVLMLDDDLQISSPDVTFAFSVWKRYPDQLVGFVPRTHVTTAPGVYGYSYNTGAAGGVRYSMTLTSAAFLHRRYLQLYREQPREVIDMVDKGQNCEDITMNFIVALWLAKQKDGGESKARAAAVYVKALDMQNLEGDTKSGYHGLWHRKDHMEQRSHCLNQLAKIYGSMPLRYSNLMLTRKHP
ncbi:exostosin-like 2 [Engraulis encrasicolus]|uniref:exostosin-like 2 n=1 Tax=Engraulis encrasicolus TaxID=184585 RepID=UPI002FCFAC14